MFCDLGAVCFLELSWAVWMLRKVRDVYFVKIFWIVMFLVSVILCLRVFSRRLS